MPYHMIDSSRILLIFLAGVARSAELLNLEIKLSFDEPLKPPLTVKAFELNGSWVHLFANTSKLQSVIIYLHAIITLHRVTNYSLKH